MDILVRAEIPSDSGLGADKFTNSFSFTDVPDLTTPTLNAILIAVEQFYLGLPTGALNQLNDFYSGEVSLSAGLFQVKAYDATGHLTGTTPMGAPVKTLLSQWEAPAAEFTDLPAEVALCVTLETETRAEEAVEIADSGDAGIERDRPMQRHTGRIFLGPLQANVLTTVDGIVRPAENILDTARLAVDQLKSSAFVDAGGSQLAVWSRKDAVMRPVGFVSVDNAFDTIRSRGPKATIRQRDAI